MKLIVGNQKTYLNKEEAKIFIEKTKHCNCSEIVICPSYVYIDMFATESKFIIGSQNVSEKENGATTGEISAQQLKSLGVKYSIVAHSERRNDQKENSDIFYNKINNLLKNDIKPIFCIGEQLNDKEQGITKDIIGKQILEVFDKFTKEELEKVIIAYEPVWAIGTGLTPNNEEIIDTTMYIKDLVNDKYDVDILVLYGGSVNSKNIKPLNEMDIVDGYLIGGASTKADELISIIEETN